MNITSKHWIARSSNVSTIFPTLLLLLTQTAWALPAGFVDEPVASSPLTLDIAFAPQGNGAPPLLLLAGRTGILRVIEDPDNSSTATVAADLSGKICSSTGERGLLSVEVHPDFVNNRYVYLFYSAADTGLCMMPTDIFGIRTRVSRFVMKPDNTLDLGSEKILIQTVRTPTAWHIGGDMAFGKDGYLYVSFGDGGYQEPRWPEKPYDLFGTLVRITDDGDIPPDNPFTQANGYDSKRCNQNGRVGKSFFCEEIYMLGFRNPFRLAMDHNSDTVRIFVNDVGHYTWEEITEIVPAMAGSSAGWPTREGPCVYEGEDFDCPADNTFIEPLYWYRHQQKIGCIIGGAFVPSGVWPAEYEGAYFFADYVFVEMYVLRPDADNQCRDCFPPRPAYKREMFHEWPSLLRIMFGPYKGSQTLYYANQFNDIRRIVYVGEGNVPPVANLVFGGHPTIVDGMAEVQVGEQVQFDASGSSDPDGINLSYEWIFGDGSRSASAGPTTLHAFGTDGIYYVSVAVTDGMGGRDLAYVKVRAGDPPDDITVDVGDEGGPPGYCRIPIVSLFLPGC